MTNAGQIVRNPFEDRPDSAMTNPLRINTQ